MVSILLLFLFIIADKFIKHPEGDQTVTNVLKHVSNINEFTNERPHFIEVKAAWLG